jgi:hypothetical protein
MPPASLSPPHHRGDIGADAGLDLRLADPRAVMRRLLERLAEA